MKALILGGTRQAGVHLVNELVATGHEVTIANRGRTPDPFGEKVNRLIIERQDPASLQKAFQGRHYDVTIDNIAYSSNEVKHLLDTLSTGKYILTSTVSVYVNLMLENEQNDDSDISLHEDDVDTTATPLKWCDFKDTPYDEAKRQAEAALFQAYPNQLSAAVRFPYIFGADDATKRLYFYVEHVFNQRPMHIDNLTARLSFIHSAEAGRFLAHAATAPVTGYVNAGSSGTISLEEIIGYTQERAAKKAIIQESGTPGPMNQVPSFALDTTKAASTGFKFLDISSWVYPLIDQWVSELQNAVT